MQALAESSVWDYGQWDVALEAQAPHAVGVAVKPLRGGDASAGSVDRTAFEQLMKRGQKGGGGGGSGSRGGGKGGGGGGGGGKGFRT